MTDQYKGSLRALAPTYDLLSVDVEDYYHVEAFADCIPSTSWPGFPVRVAANTDRVLRLLDEYRCRATFFILGWVAERHPKLVREISDNGHEVACHSYSHRRVTSLTPTEFRADLRRARAVIEDAAGVKVVGYRAPTFSITRQTLWALEILSEEGFLYDSSIFPIRHDLYGFPGSPQSPYLVEFGSKATLFEIPMSTFRLGGINWPTGGGGYLRHLPMQYTRWAIRRIRKEQRPLVMYFHPWELDPDQPTIPGKWTSRLRHYRGLGKMESRLREVLSERRFVPLREFIHYQGHQLTPHDPQLTPHDHQLAPHAPAFIQLKAD
jgi:polysaccharide deacetylase family protein (PEP-CTERM system associated)